MSEEPAQNPSTPGLTRGFLFADLRGYTAYVGNKGAAAASALLDRYRALVRKAVAEHQGAEIKTEGDSFYVVFASVSAAVRCGLEILEAVTEVNRDHPEAPIAVGIGVHAGETVENGDGYVGTAVNVAARLCAQAAAGELLVSDTVRILTASVLPVRYVSRGRQQLKGIPEPVAVYRAERGEFTSAPISSRLRSARSLAVAAIAAMTLLVAASLGWLALGQRTTPLPSSSPVAGRSPSPQPSSQQPPAASSPIPLKAGDLAPATYVTQRFQPSVVMSVPEGWSASLESPDYFLLRLTSQPDDQLTFHRVLRASSDGCFGASQPIVGSLGLHDWLESRPELTVGTLIHRSVLTISGALSVTEASASTASAWQVDIQAIGGGACGSGRGSGVYLFPLSDAEITEIDPAKQWVFIRQGQRARIVVADLPAGIVTLVEQTLADSDFTRFSTQAGELLDHIAFVSR